MSMDRGSRDAVRVARALGDPTRFELLRRIAERGEICCRDLTALLGLSQGPKMKKEGLMEKIQKQP